MYRIVSLVSVVPVIVATSVSSTCKANGEACLSSSDNAPSGSGTHPQGVVLMQLRTRTSMPKVTWSESDPVLDEDFVEDDQPGGQDLARPGPEASPNVTLVKVSQVQASQHVSQDPTTPEASTVSPSPEANVTAEPDNSSATPGVNTSAGISKTENGTGGEANISESSTHVSINATANAANKTNISGACATVFNDQVHSMFAAAAPPGSPCVFGVDVRDENSHCILEDGVFGSNGWCYTTSDRSEFGACNEHCPLYGAPSTLGTKIDNVAKKLDKVAEKLLPSNTSNEADEANGIGNTTEAPAEEAKLK